MKRLLIFLLLFSGMAVAYSQDIEAEFDKNRDFTIYKTFSLTEGEIITPKDQRKISDEQLHKWVRDAISEELTDKGLTQVDSLGDLRVSYIIGSLERSGLRSNTTGGLGGGVVLNDYEESSLVIDMNDRNNFLIWRINGVTATNQQAVTMIDEVVAKGFKKFSIKPKKKKK
jgi:hypothetical protein